MHQWIKSRSLNFSLAYCYGGDGYQFQIWLAVSITILTVQISAGYRSADVYYVKNLIRMNEQGGR